MAPRTRPKTPVVYATDPQDDQRIRKGIAASERGEVFELTPEELKRMGETGELPERFERWAASRG
jgi:hypothetical protein